MALVHDLGIPFIVTGSRIREVMSDEDIPVKVSYCLVGTGKEIAYLIHIVLAAEKAACLIANLYHAYLSTGLCY